MVIDINDTQNTYDLLYADPPWKQTRGGHLKVRPNSSGSDTPWPYQTESLEVIRNHLETARDLTGENSILFLWAIDKYLIEAQQIAESLGYKLHARLIWNKRNGPAPAFTVRFIHEYLLYMYRGKFTPVALDARGKISDVFDGQRPNNRHSAKPERAYEIIEQLYPNVRKLEMYARNERDGWDCWGNEV